MAKAPVLNDVTNLANAVSAVAQLALNNEKVEEAFLNTVSRDGSGPNDMLADFDMNSHKILNVADPVSDLDGVNLRTARDLVLSLPTQIAYGDKIYQTLTGDGTTDTLTLADDPGSLGNLDVSKNGSTLVPGSDYTLVGRTLTFTTPPALGAIVLVRFDRALNLGETSAEMAKYTFPQTGTVGTVAQFLDFLWTGAGASYIKFIQAGTGAVDQLVQSKLRRRVDAEDFGVVADGLTDDTAAMANAIARARATSSPLYLPAGTIKTSSVLDISGVTLIGVSKGYRNAQGTVIQGAGTHDVLAQLTGNAEDTVMGLHNLRIKGGLWGIKVRYMLHSHFSNVHITDCADGFQFGNSSDVGGLFNTIDNMEVQVTGTALDLNGNGFVNANSFNQCFFMGDQYGGRVRCTGGIGAVDNMFNACEFLGARYGIELVNSKNTVLNGCYFESLGPSILLGGYNLAWAANNCVFAGLLNTNVTGRSAFVYHVSGALNRGSVKGGYSYVPADAAHNNLSFFASEQTSNFYLSVVDEPDLEVAASGFVMYNNLLSANLSITTTGNYLPTWTGSGGNPAIGNGSLTGSYSRVGNTCTAVINASMGSTTTFGSGVWSFGLPFLAAGQQAGVAWMRDAGTTFYVGTALVGTGQQSASIYTNNSPNNAGPSQPFTWTTGDDLTITITYAC